MNGKVLLGLLLGFLATASWGSFYIAGRWLYGEEGNTINSWLVNFLRFSMAAVALSPLLVPKKTRELIFRAFREDLLEFLIIAATGIVLESSLVFCSLKFTTAARSSLMANCSPIATVILAWVMLRQKSSPGAVVGMFIGFAGIVLAAVAKGGDIYADTGWRTLVGDAMSLASGIFWAYFTVKGAKVSKKYGGPVCMAVCFLLGAAMMAPVLLFTVRTADFSALTPRMWGGVLYTGVVTLALANACWYGALRYLKPGVLGAFGYLSAAITFTLSALVLKERFTPPFIIAIILILGGMALMMRMTPPPEKRENENKL